MNIIRTSTDNLTKKEQFKLCRSNDIKKMSENTDTDFTVDKWVYFADTKQEVDNKTGEVLEKTEHILSFEVNETGEFFATNSETFINGFIEIWDNFREEDETAVVIIIKKGKSKAGREFIYCEMA